MLTLILLVAACIPFIIFTMNWKLPWEFKTRHCTSGWRREKCKAGMGWNQMWLVQGHLESGEVSWALSGALRPGRSIGWSQSRASFQKVELLRAATWVRRNSGLRLLFFWRLIEIFSVSRREGRAGLSSSHSWRFRLWRGRVGLPSFGRYRLPRDEVPRRALSQWGSRNGLKRKPWGRHLLQLARLGIFERASSDWVFCPWEDFLGLWHRGA